MLYKSKCIIHKYIVISSGCNKQRWHIGIVQMSQHENQDVSNTIIMDQQTHTHTHTHAAQRALYVHVILQSGTNSKLPAALVPITPHSRPRQTCTLL